MKGNTYHYDWRNHHHHACDVSLLVITGLFMERTEISFWIFLRYSSIVIQIAKRMTNPTSYCSMLSPTVVLYILLIINDYQWQDDDDDKGYVWSTRVKIVKNTNLRHVLAKEIWWRYEVIYFFSVTFFAEWGFLWWMINLFPYTKWATVYLLR